VSNRFDCYGLYCLPGGAGKQAPRGADRGDLPGPDKFQGVRGGRPFGIAAWLSAVLVAEILGVLLLWGFFIRTEHGQRLDTLALDGGRVGQAHTSHVTNVVLNTMSVLAIAAAIAAVAFIALLRGRIAVALVALGFIAGANLTTQVLKVGLYRPRLGVDLNRDTAGNSFPSGHTTAAAAVAVALVFVVPARLRGLTALFGAGFAALVGVATLSAGWHRPSDAVAGILVVGGWASAAALALLVLRTLRPEAPMPSPAPARSPENEPPHWVTVGLLALVGAGLLMVAAVTLHWTNQVIGYSADELSRRRQFAAYAGGAAGIAGTAALVLAVITATVHAVVAAPLPRQNLFSADVPGPRWP
jgi:membrane-associated phospholipid phosphatase